MIFSMKPTEEAVWTRGKIMEKSFFSAFYRAIVRDVVDANKVYIQIL